MNMCKIRFIENVTECFSSCFLAAALNLHLLQGTKLIESIPRVRLDAAKNISAIQLAALKKTKQKTARYNGREL